MIYNTLRNLGMTENEVKLYLVLLKNGELSSGEIIKKTEFQSSVVFHLLDKLSEKGFVGHVSENNRKMYSATDPSYFETLLEAKEESLRKTREKLKESMKEMKKIQKVPKDETKVTVLKGIKGIQSIFDDVLNNSTSFWNYSTRNTFAKVMPKYREYFREMRLARKIKQRMIIADTERGPKRPNQDKRYVPLKYSSPISMEGYNNKIVIFVWDNDPPIAIVLEGDKISKSFKGMFETMWKQAKR